VLRQRARKSSHNGKLERRSLRCKTA
jgi:hypothetical protein